MRPRFGCAAVQCVASWLCLQLASCLEVKAALRISMHLTMPRVSVALSIPFYTVLIDVLLSLSSGQIVKRSVDSLKFRGDDVVEAACAPVNSRALCRVVMHAPGVGCLCVGECPRLGPPSIAAFAGVRVPVCPRTQCLLIVDGVVHAAVLYPLQKR